MNPNDFVTISTDTPAALKGCKYIYAPAGQAGEYAPLAANPYKGCGHGCKYCYVPLVTHVTREEFDKGAHARKDYLDNLRKDAEKYQAAGITEQVFFSFTTDVYSPFDRSLTRPSLQIVQEHGMGICVLTKGGSRALADIDLYRPYRDCFASSLTSLDEAFSLKWEPAAALPEDRIATLKTFHERGIFTWVSLEPTLDVDSSLAIVEATHEFVDLYKIGRANYCGEITRTTNWEDYTHRMIALCEKLRVTHYIKRDLQPYLPAGYNNPLRVRQHHGPAGTTKPLSPLKLAKAKAVAEIAAREKAKASAQRRQLEEEISSVADGTGDEEKTFSKAPVVSGEFDVAKTTSVVFEEKAEVERLKAEANEIAAELFGHISKLGSRLTSVLLRIKEQLPHGEWTAWYEEFREKYSLKSLRQVQRDFKQLTAGDDESEEEEPEDDAASDEFPDGPSGFFEAVYESPAQLLTKRLKELHTVLAEGIGPVDANPIRDAEGRNTKALELVESVQLAIDEGLLDQPTDGCITCMHRGIADLALANPGWTDEQLAEASGHDITMVRQARIRFLAWKDGVA